MKIEPNFRSLFYHDWINKTFCSREQSTSHVHAHTLVELKKKHNESYKIVRFWQVIEKRFVVSSREVAWHFLFSCFDHFVDVFDYSVGRSMLSCYHGVHRMRGRVFFPTQNCFSQKYWSLILALEGQTDPQKLQQTVEWLLSLTVKKLKRERHLEYPKIQE